MDHGYLKDGTRHGGQIRAAPIGTGGWQRTAKKGQRSTQRDTGWGGGIAAEPGEGSVLAEEKKGV